MTLSRRFFKDRKGATAIEFAFVALPFIVITVAIIDIGVMNFIQSGLDNAVHKTVRKVRIGSAQNLSWNLEIFKSTVCANMALSFGCSNNLKVNAKVITNMNSVSMSSGIVNGNLSVVEGFNAGMAGDYVLVQAYLTWNPVMNLYPYSSTRLNSGEYVLGASDLFKNEPF